MIHIRILVTGSRDFLDAAIAGAAIDEVVGLHDFAATATIVTIVHGAARGADRTAARAARRLGYSTEAHPADWDAYADPEGKRGNPAGFIRNAEMVAAGADYCIAFPMHPPGTTGKSASRGTWHCADTAVKAGIPTFVVHDGVMRAYGTAAEAVLGTGSIDLTEETL